MSLVCTVYYLIAAEQADSKVRRVRSIMTVEHLRVSWNKSTTPYLAILTSITRPKFTKYSPKKIRIPRPPDSSYKEPITAWLYYDGPLSSIGRHDKVILDIPGGGFVAMNPRNHDDKLYAWSGKTGLPVLSLDYRKAPEFPYPYALNECYDAYHTLSASQGRCIGLSGEKPIKIIVTGDSAGGNLATALVLLMLQKTKLGANRQSNVDNVPIPEGLILLYPALEMNMNSWMTDEQMSLIHSQRGKEANRRVLRKKSQDFHRHDPSTPQPSDDEEEEEEEEEEEQQQLHRPSLKPSDSSALLSDDDDLQSPHPPQNARKDGISKATQEVALAKPRVLKTRLAMSSMISYVNDRVITPEMMRAMVILYVGPHTRPDFTTDYLLSPILAPDILLAEFPKTYFLTGERDPLVDDTVIFAGRIRQAKYSAYLQRKELGLLSSSSRRSFNERDHVEVNIIPGISHGFVQFVGVFPEAWIYIFRCTKWMNDIFAGNSSDTDNSPDHTRRDSNQSTSSHPATTPRSRHHFRTGTESSGDEERPLEMTPLSAVNTNGKLIAGGKTNGNSTKHKSRGSRGKSGGIGLTRTESDGGYGFGLVAASEEDLLKRRMRGFTAGLSGETMEEPRTP